MQHGRARRHTCGDRRSSRWIPRLKEALVRAELKFGGAGTRRGRRPRRAAEQQEERTLVARLASRKRCPHSGTGGWRVPSTNGSCSLAGRVGHVAGVGCGRKAPESFVPNGSTSLHGPPYGIGCSCVCRPTRSPAEAFPSIQGRSPRSGARETGTLNLLSDIASSASSACWERYWRLRPSPRTFSKLGFPRQTGWVVDRRAQLPTPRVHSPGSGP